MSDPTYALDDFTISPAVRQDVGLFIGLAGGTGSGKTYTAMRLAKGIVGPGHRFGVVDTENKRASHYADLFDFDVLNFPAPHSSARYEAACKKMFDKGYKAIVLDSGSHEHDGSGGYLDAQEKDIEDRMKRYMEKYPDAQEWKVREKLTPSSWQKPKHDRKRMMQTLLACSSTVPIIWCFRAEEKVFASKDGKLVARPVPEWEPICGKGLPFEMTVFFMLYHENPGYIGKVIKLPENLKDIFPLKEQIGEECGKRIAEWAKGSAPKPISSTVTDSLKLADENQVSIIREKLKAKGAKTKADMQDALTSFRRQLAQDANAPIVTEINQLTWQEANQWIDAQNT